MAKGGSSGQHREKKGKIRQFGRNASERRQAEREKQARIAKERADKKKEK
jgi:hypothetical protein